MTALAVDTPVSTPNRHLAADLRFKAWQKQQLKEPQRTSTHVIAVRPSNDNAPIELVTLRLHTGRERQPSRLDLDMFTDDELDQRHIDGRVERVEWGTDEFDGKVFCETEYTLTEMIEAGREGWRDSLNPAKKSTETVAIAAPVADEDDEQDSGHAAKDELELPKYDPAKHAKHFVADADDEDDLAGAA